MLRLEGCLTGEAAETVKGLRRDSESKTTEEVRRKSTSSARELRRAKEDEYAARR